MCAWNVTRESESNDGWFIASTQMWDESVAIGIVVAGIVRFART